MRKFNYETNLNYLYEYMIFSISENLLIPINELKKWSKNEISAMYKLLNI